MGPVNPRNMMKRIKTVALALAVAVAVLFAPNAARAYTNTVIGTVANYSTMTVALTIKTNFETVNAKGTNTEFAQVKLINKNLLSLLAGPDFANTTWPAGAKLVAGWDSEWSGAILVVDSTGTNVLYNASGGGDYLKVTPFSSFGAKSGQSSPGMVSYTWYNNGAFQLADYNAPVTFLRGTGSCTEKFTQKSDASGNPTTWSDTESYSQSQAGQVLLNCAQSTTSGTITLSGHGNGSPFWLANP